MIRKTAIILTCVLLSAGIESRTTANEITGISPIGVWDLTGVDSDNTRWIATVVIRRGKDARLHGHIDWLADDGTGGREYVDISFSADSRIVRLTGTKIVFSTTIARGSYVAKMSVDGASLAGSWSSGFDDAVPGNWSATRIELQP